MVAILTVPTWRKLLPSEPISKVNLSSKCIPTNYLSHNTMLGLSLIGM